MTPSTTETACPEISKRVGSNGTAKTTPLSAYNRCPVATKRASLPPLTSVRRPPPPIVGHDLGLVPSGTTVRDLGQRVDQRLAVRQQLWSMCFLTRLDGHELLDRATVGRTSHDPVAAQADDDPSVVPRRAEQLIDVAHLNGRTAAERRAPQRAAR
jgi:hypothetical protein